MSLFKEKKEQIKSKKFLQPHFHLKTGIAGYSLKLRCLTVSLAKNPQYKEASASSLTQGKVAQYLNKKGSADFVTVTMASQQPDCLTNQTIRPV